MAGVSIHAKTLNPQKQTSVPQGVAEMSFPKREWRLLPQSKDPVAFSTLEVSSFSCSLNDNPIVTASSTVGFILIRFKDYPARVCHVSEKPSD